MTRHLRTAGILLVIASLLVACPSADPVAEDDAAGAADTGRQRPRDTGSNEPDEGRPDQGQDQAAADVDNPDTEPSDTGQPTDQPGVDALEETGSDLADTTATEVDTPRDISMDLTGCTPLPTSGSLVIDGELSDASPQWNLPNTADCSVDIGGDSPALYAIHELCNTGPRRAFDILAEGGRDDPTLTMGGVAIFVYPDIGMPDDPTDCAAQTNNVADDEGTIEAFMVPGGRRITLIASSYSYLIDGTYRITITEN